MEISSKGAKHNFLLVIHIEKLFVLYISKKWIYYTPLRLITLQKFGRKQVLNSSKLKSISPLHTEVFLVQDTSMALYYSSCQILECNILGKFSVCSLQILNHFMFHYQKVYVKRDELLCTHFISSFKFQVKDLNTTHTTHVTNQ